MGWDGTGWGSCVCLFVGGVGGGRVWRGIGVFWEVWLELQ